MDEKSSWMKFIYGDVGDDVDNGNVGGDVIHDANDDARDTIMIVGPLGM
jgi:hypothetical protein